MKLKELVMIFLVGLLFSCANEPTISIEPKGIGPITKLELAPINDSLMKTGMNLFKDKCSQCHTMEFKNTGPDISDLLYTREPEWFMNFMLNKEEMLERDAAVIKTRVNYEVDCGSQINSESDARELLEYFRIYQIWLHEFNVK